LNTLHLDITSKSKVYNSLLPQGNSYFHKFGKRNYPISDLNLVKASKFLSSKKYSKVFCNSFYGDSLVHPKIHHLASRCHTFEKELLVFTQGSTVDRPVLEHLKSKNVTIYLNLYGAFKSANLVTQNLDWEYIEYLIEFYKDKLIIEYHIFKQNILDIDPLIDLCLKNNVTLNFKKDNLKSLPLSIFDQKGEWLYDINNIDSDYDFLDQFLNDKKLHKISNAFKPEDCKIQKSVLGYNNIKFYIQNKSNKNILDLNIDKFIIEDIEIFDDIDLYINYLGYIFKNKDLYEVFNHCLCNDWSKDYFRYINLINSLGFDLSKEMLNEFESHPRYKYSYGGHSTFHETSGLKLEFLNKVPYVDTLLKSIKENKLTKLS